MARPFLSIIIPAYNEAERLPLTLLHVDRHLRQAGYSSEILVVNDGSTDRTAEIVKKMSGAVKNLKLINNPMNAGKGAAVRQGMLLAKGRIRLFMDADNSTAVDHFDLMMPHFQKGIHVVIGSRGVRGRRLLFPREPLIRRIIGWAGNAVIQITILPGVWDTQCGFKAFTEEAAERLFSLARIDGLGFGAEVLALARKLNYAFHEMPVAWVYSASSTVNPAAYLKTLGETIKIRWWLMRDAYGISRPNKKQMRTNS